MPCAWAWLYICALWCQCVCPVVYVTTFVEAEVTYIEAEVTGNRANRERAFSAVGHAVGAKLSKSSLPHTAQARRWAIAAALEVALLA